MPVLGGLIFILSREKLNVRRANEEVFKDFTCLEVLLPLEFVLPLPEHPRGMHSLIESAQKCHINYSTAKIILRDLNVKENKFVKRLLLRKEKDEKDGMSALAVCSYRPLQPSELPKVEVVSRVGWNFF